MMGIGGKKIRDENVRRIKEEMRWIGMGRIYEEGGRKM